VPKTRFKQAFRKFKFHQLMATGKGAEAAKKLVINSEL
jgi:hypothetical protein